LRANRPDELNTIHFRQAEIDQGEVVAPKVEPFHDRFSVANAIDDIIVGTKKLSEPLGEVPIVFYD
jgi:hypothetical protein